MKNIITKALLNGIAGCALLALLLFVFNGKDFLQTLLSPNTLLFGVLTTVSSAIGFRLREQEQEQEAF